MSAPDEDRTRHDLIDSQAPPPDGLKGFHVAGWPIGIEPTSTWFTAKSLNQYRTATAPEAGIEPANDWFKASCSDQQLLLRNIESTRAPDASLDDTVEPSTLCLVDYTAALPQWTGRCSNPPLRLFRPALHRLSYQSIDLSQVGMRDEKTRCYFRSNTGLPTCDSFMWPSVTSDVDENGAISRLATRHTPHFHRIVGCSAVWKA